MDSKDYKNDKKSLLLLKSGCKNGSSSREDCTRTNNHLCIVQYIHTTLYIKNFRKQRFEIYLYIRAIIIYQQYSSFGWKKERGREGREAEKGGNEGKSM